MKSMLVLVLVAACGASAAEVKTAKTAWYKMNAHDMLVLCEDVASENYKIADVNEEQLTFMTAPRWYGPEGDLESPGADGFVQMRDRSVEVAFIVQVVPLESGDVAVTVQPKTFQEISGSPKPRELAPDDPGLPPFVHGRADALALAIYDRAKPHVDKQP